MSHEATLIYSESLLREAVFEFWRRSIGMGFILMLVALTVVLGVLVALGAPIWIIVTLAVLLVLAVEGQMRMLAPRLLAERLPSLHGNVAVGFRGERQDRLDRVEVALELRHALRDTRLVDHEVEVLEERDFLFGLPCNALAAVAELPEQRAERRELLVGVGIVAIDKTPDGVALKFREKAKISPEKLGEYVTSHTGAVFTPNGVLRLVLTEDEQDNVLDVARDVLLQLRTSD